MAMESAGVLADELSASAVGTSAAVALERFEARQRPRVEAAHDNSRSLARLMFGRSRLFAFVRDQAFRVISIRSALKPILQLLESPPRRM